MANIIGSTPRVVSSADGGVVTGQLRVIAFRFVSTGATASCTVQDDNSNTIFQSAVLAAAGAVDQIIFSTPQLYNAHKVSAIAAGTLYIYMG